MAFVASAQHCHYNAWNASMLHESNHRIYVKNECCYVPIKIYLQKVGELDLAQGSQFALPSINIVYDDEEDEQRKRTWLNGGKFTCT